MSAASWPSRPTPSGNASDRPGRCRIARSPYRPGTSLLWWERTGRARPPCSVCSWVCCGHQPDRRPSSARPRRRPRRSSRGVGYLAQDVPLYRRLSAEDHIAVGAHVNRRWDDRGARQRLAALGVPTDRPVQTLSGGQHAQVGLGLALAKEPDILLLDEPVASLDPLARREFLRTLSEAVADTGMSVIVSSHLLHDLERVCDHLIFLSASRTVLCEDIEVLLASHRALVGPRRDLREVEPGLTVVRAVQTQRQTRLLVRTTGTDPRSDVARERSGPGGCGARLHGGRGGVARPRPLDWRRSADERRWSGGCTAIRSGSRSARWPSSAVLLLVTGTVMAHEYRSALASCQVIRELRGPGRSAVPWRRRHPGPGRSDSRGPAAARAVLGRTIAVEGIRGRHAQLGVDAGGEPAPVAARQPRMVVARRRALGRRPCTALVSYWRYPENALNSRFQGFDVQGIVPVSYAIFAVALGIAVGSVIRRVLPSLAVTLGLFVALRALVGVYLRPHYMAPITKLFPPVGPSSSPPGAWILSTSYAERPRRESGRRVPDRGPPRAVPFVAPQGRRSQRSVPDLQRVPPIGHLPTRQPLLGLPGHRGRCVPRARTCPGRIRMAVRARTRCVSAREAANRDTIGRPATSDRFVRPPR